MKKLLLAFVVLSNLPSIYSAPIIYAGVGGSIYHFESNGSYSSSVLEYNGVVKAISLSDTGDVYSALGRTIYKNGRSVYNKSGGGSDINALAFDNNGNLLIACGGSVEITTTNFSGLDTVASAHLGSFESIAILGDDIYAGFGGSIYKYNKLRQGNTFYNGPAGSSVTALAFDKNNNLFVGAEYNIWKYTLDGNYSLFWSAGYGSVINGLGFDSEGNLYAAKSNQIMRFGIDNSISSIWDTGGGTLIDSLYVVPEPSTYALFGIGAFGLLMVIRWKKAA